MFVGAGENVDKYCAVVLVATKSDLHQPEMGKSVVDLSSARDVASDLGIDFIVTTPTPTPAPFVLFLVSYACRVPALRRATTSARRSSCLLSASNCAWKEQHRLTR